MTAIEFYLIPRLTSRPHDQACVARTTSKINIYDPPHGHIASEALLDTTL